MAIFLQMNSEESLEKNIAESEFFQKPLQMREKDQFIDVGQQRIAASCG